MPRFQVAELAHEGSYSASVISGLVEHIVQTLVAAQFVAQLFEFRSRIFSWASHL